ncbi:2OG-Fe(II) oxygenase [Streptomyces sp. ISL-43]|uniref:2OG-Fe(II) oxygenase n=1 Tax=Streptomyces sp. ISL-43 TaxID=2819183 RepID=UPI001BE4EE36|nr:2OG-Fe(II) oxygenase [Streptomyces sp. ISL-43]MBT2450998.1 2OG-Fe(II) oxygenase [Streptomyces sp. ISL-43]
MTQKNSGDPAGLRAAERTPQELAELGALLSRQPARPVQLPEFLPGEQALRLSETVQAMPTWRSSPVVWNPGRHSTRGVSADEWDATPAELRAAVRDVAQDVPALFDEGSGYPAEYRSLLADLFVFACMGPELRALLDAWVAPGKPLRTNMEFARYGHGDRLGEHSDAESDTLFVLNLYLDPRYREADGGVLGFRNEDGEEFAMPPRFNSVSVMPIRPGCVHWVSPWRVARPGRHTVSIAAGPEPLPRTVHRGDA